ncbi:XPA protein C-terminus-domain-containing protein [Chytridium lagenaria]|nr:XPA protein C-terminus-domain-containing protein [Chytridium lagenaria]
MDVRKQALLKIKAAGRPPPMPAQSSTVTAVTSIPQPAGSQNLRRKRSEIDLTYCEYNFSTMHDTKAGFMVEDEQESKKLKADAKPLKTPLFDTSTEGEGASCCECRSLDIDVNYQQHYGVVVCRECRDKNTEKYSLLTKTECKTDYLLTDSELKDHTIMPCWEKPNPHKSTYAHMLLYLRMQVENFAKEKWGSLENLDKEFERREEEKKIKKEQAFKKKLLGSLSCKNIRHYFSFSHFFCQELRKKTRTSIWKKEDTSHTHEYGEKEYDEVEGVTKQTCLGCGRCSRF